MAGFDPGSTQNVAVYWGQYWSQNASNVRQERLAHYCDDTSINIINIAFITGMTPVIVNLGRAGDTCTHSMTNTGLLLCKEMEEDIKICQKKGKTILVSMGGASPTASDWNSIADAEKSAQLVWDMFGPVPDGKIDRPFGSAVVDGFDFDFESPVKNLPAFGAKLRSLMDTAADKKFFLSAAPQCVTPDANVGPALDAVPFDIVQVQFYNNPCGVNQFQEDAPDQIDFNFAAWDAWAGKSKNPSVKVFLGIPASPDAAGQGSYTDGSKLKAAINWAKKYRSFGGVMMWEVVRLYADDDFLPEVVNDLLNDNQPYSNQTFASAATAITSPQSSSPSLRSSSLSSFSPLSISSPLGSTSPPGSPSPGSPSPVSSLSPPHSPSPPNGIAIPQWGQCGGKDYTGSTQCQPPYQCIFLSQWWSDCR